MTSGSEQRCTACGRANPADAAFCEHCGNALAASADTVYCERCGAENEADAAFCERCGSSLAAPPAAAAAPGDGRPARRWIPLAVLGALLLAGGIAAAVVLLTRDGGSSEAETTTTTTPAITEAATINGFPNSDEQDLIGHVPTAMQDSCSRIEDDAPADALASVACSAYSGEIAVNYFSFLTDQDMLAWYRGEALTEESDSGGCQIDSHDFAEGEHSWNSEGTPAGRYACYYVDSTPWLVWTDTRLDIGAEAFALYDGLDDSLLNRWACCLGPNL